MSKYDGLFHRICLAIEVAAGASSRMGWTREQSPERVTGTSDPSREPSGDHDAPHLRYRRRYEGCKTDRDRRAVITDALVELRALRFSRKPKVDKDTRDGRLEIGRDRRPASVVAYVYGYEVRHIHRLRAEARAHDARHPSDRLVP